MRNCQASQVSPTMTQPAPGSWIARLLKLGFQMWWRSAPSLGTHRAAICSRRNTLCAFLGARKSFYRFSFTTKDTEWYWRTSFWCQWWCSCSKRAPMVFVMPPASRVCWNSSFTMVKSPAFAAAKMTLFMRIMSGWRPVACQCGGLGDPKERRWTRSQCQDNTLELIVPLWSIVVKTSLPSLLKILKGLQHHKMQVRVTTCRATWRPFSVAFPIVIPCSHPPSPPSLLDGFIHVGPSCLPRVNQSVYAHRHIQTHIKYSRNILASYHQRVAGTKNGVTRCSPM